MDMVLIAGLWLDGSAWDDVSPALEELGHRPVPLTLPGQGDGSSSATLDDQVAAVVAAVDAAPDPVVVVGHSAACTLAWLAADARRRMADGAIPVPEGVATGTVTYTDDRRHDVPVTMVCPEYSPAEAQAWIDAGDLPELASAKHVGLVDIDSGHWPMFTKPAELARLLADATT